MQTCKNATLVGLVLAALSAAPVARADAEADFRAGRAAYNGDDVVTAMRRLGSAAEAGHGGAAALLAYIHDKAENNDLAVRYYRQAAEAQVPEGFYGLGHLYSLGEGVEQDHAQSVRWFERAAAAGHVRAMVVLGRGYLTGNLGLTPDRERGLELLRQAAQAGSAAAAAYIEQATAGEGGATGEEQAQ